MTSLYIDQLLLDENRMSLIIFVYKLIAWVRGNFSVRKPATTNDDAVNNAGATRGALTKLK